MSVMQMRNIVARAEIEPTSLPDVTNVPTPTCPCGLFPARSAQIKQIRNFFVQY